DGLCGRVEIDSRSVKPGCLFWALRGERHDGHDFLVEARSHGAAAAVVSRRRLKKAQEAFKTGAGRSHTAPLIAVDDTLTALADFARWHRSRQEGLVIGVTGSVGKTTTREMIHAVLSASHQGVRSLKNFNNHIGVPLSVLELDASHEFAVLELGASAVGEIAALAEIAKPEVGVITGIGLAHVAGFGSPEKIVLGKGELLEALPASGFAVLPGDDPLTRNMARRAACPVLFVGESERCHVRATNVRVANQWLTFAVDGDEHIEYQVPVTGRHFLQAALTALAIAREIGLSPAQIAAGFQNFDSLPGRCQVHRIGPWTVIDDSYNASPASMRAACETLRDWQGANKRLLVTGDMLELGKHTKQSHFELGRAAAEARFDGLLAFGEQAEHVIRGAYDGGMSASRLALCDHLEILLMVLDCVLEKNDVVLIKGSRSTRMERVLEWMQQQAEASSTVSESRRATAEIKNQKSKIENH
ncbi:MAG TPA: UDP-N-acetylmuramoyl-tripeptide--D-alanyl-D-alanine ligase, partial [Planctomycetaceae bacterium]|nr:UDP-N-acetylmuramoyl-tripeptide--D-alanyl-D-alanine ligase [Planctomycetaceae bacterium]